MGNAGDQDAPVAYWPADPRLREHITGYHRFRVRIPAGMVLGDVAFPSWATVRFAIEDPQPWSVQIGPRTYDPVPECAFFGPSSYAGYSRATGGTVVGFGIRPLGWAQLFGGDISRHANRVLPLIALRTGAEALHDSLQATDDPAAVLDAWLCDRLSRSEPPDPRIGRMQAMIDDPAITRIEMMADALGISARAVASLARVHFGFTPKLLLRRGRFLRALSAGLEANGGWDRAIEAAGYWDRSHFLRDSHLFLGCSIREFQARRGPLNALALAARREALGAPV